MTYRIVWITGPDPGPQPILVDPPLAPGEVEIDLSANPSIVDMVALADLIGGLKAP